MRAAVALALLLLGVAIAAPATARVFTGVGWGGSGDPADPRRLDVHTPESPGPHPVVVLAGVADADALARALAERGHVVAVLAAGRGASVAELAQALTFVHWRGGSYGGESVRLHVVAGRPAAGALLALAADPAPLRGAGLPDDVLHAIAVTGVPDTLPPAAANPPPPLLVLSADDGPGGLRAAARLAERWRAEGAAAEAVEASGARAPAEAVVDALLRWLALAPMLRAPRFESLRFSATAEDLPGEGRAVGLATTDGALLLATEGDALAVWRREAVDAPWRREWTGAAGRVLWFGRVADPGEWALLVERGGEWRLHRRRAAGDWDDGVRLGRPVAAAHAAWVVAVDEPRGAGRALLVAVDAGADSRLLRLRADGVLGLESLPGGERITGLVMHQGTPVLVVHGPRGGRLLRRVGDLAGAWITAAAWEAERGALHGLASLAPDEAGLAGVLDGGEAVRIDPARGEVQVEADLAGALARQWGPLAGGIAPGMSAALRQPHSGDRVQLTALGVRDPRDPPEAGWFVVRQAGGHYAYGRAGAPSGGGGVLRQILASPFVTDAGAVFYALDAADPPALRRAALAPPHVAAGAWADRGAPGRGVVLERTRGGWIALLHRIEADGAARWYSAGGRLRDGVFADSTGLVRHRREGDGRLAADTVGALSIRFGAAADDPACAGHPRHGAAALAVMEARLGDERMIDCIEPLRPRDAARPVVDGSGLWMAPDGAWGLAVQSTGAGPEGDERVLLFHFDAEGLPRWVLGSGTRRAGQAVVALRRDGAEGRLSYAFQGACGAVAGSASLLLPAAGGAPALVEPETALLRAAGGACY
jgi:hypothetical protein